MGKDKEKEAKDNKENRERSEERLSGAKQDLFELLERVQCSRIDDQRCVLPSKLSQVGILIDQPAEVQLIKIGRDGLIGVDDRTCQREESFVNTTQEDHQWKHHF